MSYFLSLPFGADNALSYLEKNSILNCRCVSSCFQSSFEGVHDGGDAERDQVCTERVKLNRREGKIQSSHRHARLIVFDFYIRLLCKRFIMLTFGLPPLFKACSWCHTPPHNVGPMLPDVLCSLHPLTNFSVHLVPPRSHLFSVVSAVIRFIRLCRCSSVVYSHAPPPAVNYLIIQLINAICNECEWIAIRIWPFSG